MEILNWFDGHVATDGAPVSMWRVGDTVIGCLRDRVSAQKLSEIEAIVRAAGGEGAGSVRADDSGRLHLEGEPWLAGSVADANPSQVQVIACGPAARGWIETLLRDTREAGQDALTAIRLADQYWADLAADGRQDSPENERAWLWHTCPAAMRSAVGGLITRQRPKPKIAD